MSNKVEAPLGTKDVFVLMQEHADMAAEVDRLKRKARDLRLHAYEGETTEVILYDLVSYYKALGQTLPEAISDLENVWERTQR